ncbi:MAG: sodium dependent transporter [Deltaproteobacteria bacterium]|nr:sodium dependent transporter [Deltaproteobacteria bacterium]
MDNPILLHFVSLTIFTLMFALGVNHSFEELISLWRQPGLLLRSLIAVIFLVPLAAVFLLWVLNLPPAAATGLAVLAAAPGAPLTYKRSQMAGGDPTYTASLQLTLALLAVVITPAILALFSSLFELVIGGVALFQVARQVAQVTFLPVMIGLSLQQFAPRLAEVVRQPARRLADILFIVLLLMLVLLLSLAPQFRAMLQVGWLPLLAILLMAAFALIIGHLLGGPDRGRRSALATACLARNIGLALFLAELCNYGQQFIPTILAYMICGGLLGVPYALWSKRQL